MTILDSHRAFCAADQPLAAASTVAASLAGRESPGTTWPAAVLRRGRGTRLLADVRFVLQHPSHPAGPSQAGSASHRSSRNLCSSVTGSSLGKSVWSTAGLVAGSRQRVHIPKRYSTRYSRVVTQRSTDLAQSSLPSVIGRERGYSGWYDRSMEATPFWQNIHEPSMPFTHSNLIPF